MLTTQLWPLLGSCPEPSKWVLSHQKSTLNRLQMTPLKLNVAVKCDPCTPWAGVSTSCPATPVAAAACSGAASAARPIGTKSLARRTTGHLLSCVDTPERLGGGGRRCKRE